MLPGFRFLFAAIMFSMSLLVFGLGAASLLRAAHESFASNSSWRAAPEAAFVQHSDATLPMLATLSVDTTAVDKPIEPASVSAIPAEQPVTPAASADVDQVAATKPAETPAVEIAKPDAAPIDVPVAETPPPPAAAPTVEVATTPSKVAAATASDIAPAGGELAPALPETAPLPSPDPMAENPATTDPATTVPAATAEASASAKIATLGGPAVDVAEEASAIAKKATKPDTAKADRAAIKRRAEARRAAQRRRYVLRARLAAQQQLQANPFGQQQLAQQPQQFAPATPRQ